MSTMVIFTRVVSNVNLKMFILPILAKGLVLGARMCRGRVSADGNITVLKIQTEICKDGRRVKMDSF